MVFFVFLTLRYFFPSQVQTERLRLSPAVMLPPFPYQCLNLNLALARTKLLPANLSSYLLRLMKKLTLNTLLILYCLDKWILVSYQNSPYLCFRAHIGPVSLPFLLLCF